MQHPSPLVMQLLPDTVPQMAFLPAQWDAYAALVERVRIAGVSHATVPALFRKRRRSTAPPLDASV